MVSIDWIWNKTYRNNKVIVNPLTHDLNANLCLYIPTRMLVQEHEPFRYSIATSTCFIGQSMTWQFCYMQDTCEPAICSVDICISLFPRSCNTFNVLYIVIPVKLNVRVPFNNCHFALHPLFKKADISLFPRPQGREFGYYMYWSSGRTAKL